MRSSLYLLSIADRCELEIRTTNVIVLLLYLSRILRYNSNCVLRAFIRLNNGYEYVSIYEIKIYPIYICCLFIIFLTLLPLYIISILVEDQHRVLLQFPAIRVTTACTKRYPLHFLRQPELLLQTRYSPRENAEKVRKSS